MRRTRRDDPEAAAALVAQVRALVGYLFVAIETGPTRDELDRMDVAGLRRLAVEQEHEAPCPLFARRAVELLDDADELLGAA